MLLSCKIIYVNDRNLNVQIESSTTVVAFYLTLSKYYNNLSFFLGYMLLYLMVLQMLTLFCSHLLMTQTASSILLMLSILTIASVGGYIIHIGEIPSYLWWSESLSPQRWMLPIIIADEFSQETLSNTAGQQLCRNKHV